MVLSEPTAAALLEALEGEAARVISPVSVLESGIVLRAGACAPIVTMVHVLLVELGVEAVAFDEIQARPAIQGDCAVYVLATSRGRSGSCYRQRFPGDRHRVQRF